MLINFQYTNYIPQNISIEDIDNNNKNQMYINPHFDQSPTQTILSAKMVFYII